MSSILTLSQLKQMVGLIKVYVSGIAEEIRKRLNL